MLVLAVTLVLSGCGHFKGEVKSFDPNAEVSIGTPSDFFKLKMDRLRPADLKPSRSPSRIGAGDTLEIEVLQHPETLSQVLVMPDGMIYYDLAEGVRAQGLLPAELEKKLESILQEFYTASVVTVSIRDHRSRSYTIYGAVANAGTYPLNRPTTLVEALSDAGGTGSGDLDRSIVIRNEKVLPINFRDLVERGDVSQNVYLVPGDLIFLPEPSESSVYVLGSVNRAAAIPWTRNLHILPAIASVGGLNSSAAPQKIALIRGSLTDPEVAVIPLNDILTGKAPSVYLQPDDILWVPTSAWKQLEEQARVFVYAAATTLAVRAANEATEGVRSDDGARGGSVSIPVESVPTSAPAP